MVNKLDFIRFVFYILKKIFFFGYIINFFLVM